MAEDRMLSDEILLGLIKKNGGSGGTMTAGDYIDITNGEISVDREIPSVIAEYEIKTEPMVSGQAFISITKTVNGEIVLTQKYGSSTAGITQGINFDENIYVDYSKTASWSWTYKLRNASVDHAANYTQSWNYGSTVDYTEEFVVTDHSGDKLVIKSEMDTALSGKQNTLTFDDTPTDSSDNPVKSNGIYDALATKADTDMVAADFNAGSSYTAGNYCVQDGKLYKFKNNHTGAWSSADVDEVKITGELSALKSGLTSVKGVLNTDGKVLNFTVAGEGADYVAEFRGATAPTIIADKNQGGTITASVRLFLNIEEKKIEAGYFDGTNWQYQTLVQFT